MNFLVSILFTHSVLCVNIFENYVNVKFIFIHGETPNNNTAYSFENFNSLVDHPQFNLSRQTVIYCHGWIGNLEYDGTQLVTKAYIKRNDHNIIVLDWGQYSLTNFPSAVIRSSAIAKLAGQSLLTLFQLGLNANKIHCIGHSMGVHVCGIMGREISRLSNENFKIRRITGLDPSFHFYYPAIAGEPLSKHDAHFVDVIHTDSFMAGFPFSVGHVDFYPNNGKLQSGCANINLYDLVKNYCSHHVVYLYYIESLMHKQRYPAKQCSSWRNFKAKKCEDNPINFMGFDAIPGIEGQFYADVPATSEVYFENFNMYSYIFKAFLDRSDIAKLFKKLTRS